MAEMISTEAKMTKLVEKLDEYRPDMVGEVKAMQKSLKTALLKKNLSQHPALKLMLDTLRKREAGYSLVIDNKEDLPEDKRKMYFARRAEVRFILSFFDVAATLESIDSRLDKELDMQLSDEVPELSTEPNAKD